MLILQSLILGKVNVFTTNPMGDYLRFQVIPQIRMYQISDSVVLGIGYNVGKVKFLLYQ